MTMKVYIVNGNAEYESLFRQFGWEITTDFISANLIQFTGGPDVTPRLYGQSQHIKSNCNEERDAKEAVIFASALNYKIPMVGICRGGQFLNVMCGGSMYQHVDGHATLDFHDMLDKFSGEVIQVTSTHHQVMDPSKDATIIAVAKQTTWMEKTFPITHNTVKRLTNKKEEEVEVAFYSKQNALCFQPHPEFSYQTTDKEKMEKMEELKHTYFSYIYDYLFDLDDLVEEGIK